MKLLSRHITLICCHTDVDATSSPHVDVISTLCARLVYDHTEVKYKISSYVTVEFSVLYRLYKNDATLCFVIVAKTASIDKPFQLINSHLSI